MAVRSRRVALVNEIVHATSTTVYEVPAGRTLVLHAVVVTNRSTTNRRVLINVRSASASASIGRSADMPQDATFTPAGGPWVLNPGDALEVFHTGTATTNLVSCFASGSLLDGEPE